jgi:hypothetical protein
LLGFLGFDSVRRNGEFARGSLINPALIEGVETLAGWSFSSECPVFPNLGTSKLFGEKIVIVDFTVTSSHSELVFVVAKSLVERCNIDG